jgi:hypothetical protein
MEWDSLTPEQQERAKVHNTRRILQQATDHDLGVCRAQYSLLDNDSARKVVELCDEEMARR